MGTSNEPMADRQASCDFLRLIRVSEIMSLRAVPHGSPAPPPVLPGTAGHRTRRARAVPALDVWNTRACGWFGVSGGSELEGGPPDVAARQGRASTSRAHGRP